MNLREAIEIAGTVSTKNSKMPGPSYAISARHCNVGGKLVDKPNSVCSKCYALRLQNFRPNVDKAWETNYQKTLAACQDTELGALYVEAMVYQINRAVKLKGIAPYMRWFDSGDLISTYHLSLINRIARQTPHVIHYLPTKEAGVVSRFVDSDLQPNLIVRVSSPLIDQQPLTRFGTTTTVHTKDTDHVGFACVARDQGNKCGNCRACWDPTISNISYPKH